MSLRIFKELPVRLPRTKLNRLFEVIRRAEGRKFKSLDVNLVFTSDKHMNELNRQYRGKDKSTDVLSFCIDDGTRDRHFQGEIYISVPTAKRQAITYGGTLAEENLRLVCHGFLHLMGYDHQNPDEAATMKRLEDHYLDQLHS